MRTTRDSRRAALGVLWLVACGTPEAPAPIEVPSAWPGELVRDEAAFEALLATEGRDGWAALHRRDLTAARAAFDPSSVGAARTRLEQAVLHADLARLDAQVTHGLRDRWLARGLPAGTFVAGQLAVASWCVDGAVPQAVLAAATAPDHPDGEAVGALVAGNPLPTGAFADRVAAWASGDPEILVGLAATAWRTEQDGVLVREHTDPCALTALARKEAEAWTDGPDALLSGLPLAGVLFAPWPDAGALRTGWSDLEHLDPLPDPSRLGLPTAADDDDTETAAGEVVAIDEALDRLGAGWTSASTEGGRALLEQLDVLRRWRHDLLVARGRQALLAGHPHRALSLLERAVEPTAELPSPRRSPHLQVLLAEARLATGRTREALDALAPLRVPYPETGGLFERMADLSVMEGLDRHGDSKEY